MLIEVLHVPSRRNQPTSKDGELLMAVSTCGGLDVDALGKAVLDVVNHGPL